MKVNLVSSTEQFIVTVGVPERTQSISWAGQCFLNDNRDLGKGDLPVFVRVDNHHSIQRAMPSPIRKAEEAK
jgi:hypothetical protein